MILSQNTIWKAAKTGDFSFLLSIASESPADLDLPEVGGSGRTPLIIACANNHITVVMLLLEGQVDVNAKCSESGWTALHYALD